ncbi:hypothetical protein [Alicyclobacillus acidiphilus]|uniref:hypothetical protein n=1 Tax=Alicyclobacillus acidiphilus TaxID=182455 RepID=UPI00082EBCF4|nr:hypothetical protein [Alicyclobacillus acidiphilus]
MDWQRLAKQKWLIFLAALGVILLSVSTLLPKRADPATTTTLGTGANVDDWMNGTTNGTGGGGTTTPLPSVAEIETYYDSQLERILSKIAGIRAVTVMVTTTPSSGKTSQPQVIGVLVTVNADNFFTAKSEIVESITNVLDVPAYKISVEPQKGN